MTDYLLVSIHPDETLDSLARFDVEAFSTLHPGDVLRDTKAAMVRLADRAIDPKPGEKIGFVRLSLDDAVRYDAEIERTVALVERSLG